MSDARIRAIRTLWQGLVVDVVLAVLAVIGSDLGTFDLTDRQAWIGLAVLLGKTALTAAASYIARSAYPPPGA